MLGFIEGKVISKNNSTLRCVILAGQVGYELTIARGLFESLSVGEATQLWIETVAKENAVTLYGFSTEQDKKFFRLLLAVSGLGPKTALSLLSEHGVHRLVELITTKDDTQIATAPGVGKKSAQRIVLELAGPVDKWIQVEQWVLKATLPSKAPAQSADNQLREDLSSALLNLGYQPTQTKNLLEKLFRENEVDKLDFEKCLKWALKEVSGRVITHPRKEEAPLHG